MQAGTPEAKRLRGPAEVNSIVNSATHAEETRYLGKRLTFLGIVAWLSVCLLAAGWIPSLTHTHRQLLAFSGLLGLVSAVGLAVSVKSEMRVQRLLYEAYLSEARTDALTGLANRRAFDAELEARVTQLEQKKASTIGLMLLDVDHFKRFNDEHGHQAGDEMLREVAKTLQANLRTVDRVARYGGEEFAVILPEISAENANRVAERARQAIATHEFRYRGKVHHVTVSIGICISKKGSSVTDVLRDADNSLYAAKNSGRNRVRHLSFEKKRSHATELAPVAVLT